ncbi:hypothetical protein VTO42DRAFT_4697 [Malbranchea cinnamomea]
MSHSSHRRSRKYRQKLPARRAAADNAAALSTALRSHAPPNQSAAAAAQNGGACGASAGDVTMTTTTMYQQQPQPQPHPLSQQMFYEPMGDGVGGGGGWPDGVHGKMAWPPFFENNQNTARPLVQSGPLTGGGASFTPMHPQLPLLQAPMLRELPSIEQPSFNTTMPSPFPQHANFLPPRRYHSPPSPPRVPDPVAPKPTKEYLDQAARDTQPVTTPQPLLVILDLNGTLIFRKKRRIPAVFVKRPGLEPFLDYLFANFKVMIWTSSKPETVASVLDRMLTKESRAKLIATWARDTLDLTKEQYQEKVQVYKRLDKVWNSSGIQATYPRGTVAEDGNQNNAEYTTAAATATTATKGQWNQTNTVLIDDSAVKAVAHPHNIIEIPEFRNDPTVDEEKNLRTVMRQLRILSYQADVSRKLREWADRRHQSATSMSPDAVDDFWDAELEREEEALSARLGGGEGGGAGQEWEDTEEQVVEDAQRLMGERLHISDGEGENSNDNNNKKEEKTTTMHNRNEKKKEKKKMKKMMQKKKSKRKQSPDENQNSHQNTRFRLRPKQRNETEAEKQERLARRAEAIAARIRKKRNGTPAKALAAPTAASVAGAQ